MRTALIGLAALLALAGCSEITVARYDRATYHGGFVYAEPQPYVSIARDGATTIIYLPDPRHKYVVRQSGLFGNASLKPSFNPNGTLAGIDASVDKTAPLTALVGSLAGAAATAAPAMAARFGEHATGATGLKPGLYRLDLRSDPPRLVGPIAVTQSKGS